jgi:hypothetical protein
MGGTSLTLSRRVSSGSSSARSWRPPCLVLSWPRCSLRMLPLRLRRRRSRRRPTRASLRRPPSARAAARSAVTTGARGLGARAVRAVAVLQRTHPGLRVAHRGRTRRRWQAVGTPGSCGTTRGARQGSSSVVCARLKSRSTSIGRDLRIRGARSRIGTLDPRRQEALLTRKWPGDIRRQEEQLEILRFLRHGG